LSLEIQSDQMAMFGDKAPDKIEVLLREVLPPDDSSIRFSEARGGLAEELDSTFDQLYYRLVERYLDVRETQSRDDDEIWQVFRPSLQDSNVLDHLQRHEVRTELETFEFDYAWKNGTWNALKPLSFDHVHPGHIRNKAKQWMGAAYMLDESDLSSLFFLLGCPRNGDKLVKRAYADAKQMLRRSPVSKLKVELVEEEDASDFAERLKKELEAYQKATKPG
jgi:hypothetical protein